MKKILVLIIALILVTLAFSIDSVEAKKAGKGKGLSPDDMTTMGTTIDGLTKKMYANALFSPDDNENLIDVKIKLDNQMLMASDPALAPLYYKIGVLYKTREMKDESIECFQTVLENFADTALAPKAAAQLKTLGVVVAAPKKDAAAGGE